LVWFEPVRKQIMGTGNDSRHNWRVHWTEQDGVELPRSVGGHPALDFCNTWAGWSERSDADDSRREWLSSYDVLTAWAAAAGLLEDARALTLRDRARERPAEAAEVLDRARVLRAAVHDAVLDPEDQQALALVTVEVRRAGALIALGPDQRDVAAWSPTDDGGLDLPVLAVAWSAALLLASAAVAKVAACPGVDCGWLFVDSRGRRRWCDMAVCGNRAKVAAHARRARERAG
jgi:predicted RNA-binding Zn ribbon-like protein